LLKVLQLVDQLACIYACFEGEGLAFHIFAFRSSSLSFGVSNDKLICGFQGATIIDQSVTIVPEPDYELPPTALVPIKVCIIYVDILVFIYCLVVPNTVYS